MHDDAKARMTPVSHPRRRLPTLDSSWLLSWPDRGSPWVHRAVLMLIGLWAFFHHLDMSLMEGSEGLYAQIAREMVAAQRYFALMFHGEPYINKPPMFFWLLGVMREWFGESETALRLPGAIGSLGTMWLTYALGCRLFSRMAGFWAAVVVGTTHVFLWYGRRVLFDSTLTFAMTLAVFAWIRAAMQAGWPGWYVVAFVAMAVGGMIKSIHAFAMPFAIMVIYAFWQRDYRALRSPVFWSGFVMYWLLTGWYASWLPEGMQWQFDIHAAIQRAFGNFSASEASTSRLLRLHWYLSMMWFDFFPWSALIPASTLLLALSPASALRPVSRFLLLWFWGYIAMLSVSLFKREPYLMPLVPALGLMVGYTYQAVAVGLETRRWLAATIRVMLALLALVFGAALFVGPYLLQRKWHVPFPPFPFIYTTAMMVMSLVLFWSAVTARARLALATVGVLAFGFVIGVVDVIWPMLDRFAPRAVNAEVRRIAAQCHRPVFYHGITQEDFIFYLNSSPAIPRLTSKDDVRERLGRHRQILLVTDYRYAKMFAEDHSVIVRILRTFPRPKDRDFYLLSLQLASSKESEEFSGLERKRTADRFLRV
ncbi:MAG: glycosyltransferase family 39 protein [Nitrospirae bacterium]|nr:MAG: glycosyltransferase family 39 protein [Nitrospirota bacterium]